MQLHIAIIVAGESDYLSPMCCQHIAVAEPGIFRAGCSAKACQWANAVLKGGRQLPNGGEHPPMPAAGRGDVKAVT